MRHAGKSGAAVNDNGRGTAHGVNNTGTGRECAFTARGCPGEIRFFLTLFFISSKIIVRKHMTALDGPGDGCAEGKQCPVRREHGKQEICGVKRQILCGRAENKKNGDFLWKQQIRKLC